VSLRFTDYRRRLDGTDTRRAYTQDLRERLFQASDAGMRIGQIAAALMVSVLYVSKALSRRRLTGEITARAQRCHVPPKLAGLHDTIKERIAVVPDTTLLETEGLDRGRTSGGNQRIAAVENSGSIKPDSEKKPFSRPSKTVPISPRHARPSGRSNPRSIPEC
jgi:hypothetical protein